MTSLEKYKNFSNHLLENVEYITALMGGSSDFIIREVKISNCYPAVLFYLDGMVDKQDVQEVVISSLLDLSLHEGLSLQFLQESVLKVGEVNRITSMEVAVEQILSGGLLILLEDVAEGLIISIPGWKDRSITDSQTQTVVKGPQDSFTETLRTNTTLVRRRVKDKRVRISSLKIGELTKTDIAVMYIDGIADKKLVQDLLKRLKGIVEDRVLEGEYLEEVLRGGQKQFTIFPTFYNSDRPDKIAAGIMDGKIAIFIDGSPFVLLVPSFFVDFFQSADDYYQPSFYSSIIRILRYTAFIICMLMPSLYIALTTYQQDMIPTQLLLSLSAQREGIPFPAFVEALLMEITFEILREAGLRMPRTIGQAVSIVGTLVIGQAAVEATIVSAAMVIIVAITAIASFVIPAYTMSIPVRIMRFVCMFFAASFGVYGLTICVLLLIIHLCQLQTFHIPYMSPIAPYKKEEQGDAILRLPFRSASKKKEGRQPL